MVFFHSYKAHTGFSCHILCELILVGDTRLLTGGLQLSFVQRGAWCRCSRLSDAPLWGCWGSEAEARPLVCRNHSLHTAGTVLITALLPECFAGRLLYSLTAFHLLFRSYQLAVLFLYSTYHPGMGQNHPSGFSLMGFSLFHPHLDFSAVSPRHTLFWVFSTQGSEW